jgi:light-regulated signal transduction histidine kinase (bacteriophytochrome)
MNKVVESVLYNKALKTNTQLKVAPMDDVVADSDLMRQVWENLIGNAIKFSSKTEMPKIEIGHTRQNGEQVFWIKDNGVGFDAHYSDKLFKVFSRLHGKKEFEGTGAGLAISKKIIDAHGGRIWAEAQLSKGATFYFTLPVVEQKKEAGEGVLG